MRYLSAAESLPSGASRRNSSARYGPASRRYYYPRRTGRTSRTYRRRSRTASRSSMSGKYWNPSSSPAKTILHRLNVSASCLASVLANRHPQQSYLGSDSAGLARLSLGRRQQLCWYREPSMSGLRAGSRLDSERAGPRWATASCAGGEERGRGCRLGDGRRLSFRWWEGSRDARAPPEGQRESARERERVYC